MPAVLSNQLKAMLVLEDISEQGVSVLQDQSFTVQHFSYRFSRNRNATGMPYGPTLEPYMDFTVKIAAEDSAKQFLERMKAPKPFPFSFLFNASFNASRRLSGYEDAMVARGYIVDLDEVYDVVELPTGKQEQMLIKVRLLLSKLSYVGSSKVLNLKITND